MSNFAFDCGPKLITIAYQNGPALDTFAEREPIINALAKFPVIVCIAFDGASTGGPYAQYPDFRTEIRRKNPRIKMLGHITGTESRLDDSPGHRAMMSVCGATAASTVVSDANFSSTTALTSAGNELPVLAAGQEFIITSSTNNDGEYTVATSSVSALTINETWTATGSDPGANIIEGHVTYGLPSNASGNYWYENPGGTIAIASTPFGDMAYRDLSKTDAQNILVQGILAQYAEHGAWRWDGVFIDQFIVAAGTGSTFLRGAGASAGEQAAQLVGLRSVMERVRKALGDAIIICNSSNNFDGANGELLENRPDDIIEIETYAGHSSPEIDAYIYAPVSPEIEPTILVEYAKASVRNAYFGYAPGQNYDGTNPDNLWPNAFTTIINGSKWHNWLNSCGITF